MCIYAHTHIYAHIFNYFNDMHICVHATYIRMIYAYAYMHIYLIILKQRKVIWVLNNKQQSWLLRIQIRIPALLEVIRKIIVGYATLPQHLKG